MGIVLFHRMLLWSRLCPEIALGSNFIFQTGSKESLPKNAEAVSRR